MALTVLVENPPVQKARKTARGALSGQPRLQAVERRFRLCAGCNGVEAAQVVNAAMGADKALIADGAGFRANSPATRLRRAAW